MHSCFTFFLCCSYTYRMTLGPLEKTKKHEHTGVYFIGMQSERVLENWAEHIGQHTREGFFVSHQFFFDCLALKSRCKKSWSYTRCQRPSASRSTRLDIRPSRPRSVGIRIMRHSPPWTPLRLAAITNSWRGLNACRGERPPSPRCRA